MPEAFFIAKKGFPFLVQKSCLLFPLNSKKYAHVVYSRKQSKNVNLKTVINDCARHGSRVSGLYKIYYHFCFAFIQSLLLNKISYRS